MRKAQAKLHGMDRNVNETLFRWGLAKYNDICSTTKVSKQQKKTILPDLVDSLFSFEDTRKVWIEFLRFDTDTQDETSISYLICLDEFITNSAYL